MSADRSCPVSHPDRLYIDGEWLAPAEPRSFEVIDSGTEAVFAHIAAAGSADVARAVAAARRAFDEGPWPRMAPSERAEFLRAFGAAYAAMGAEIARTWTVESGVVHSLATATAGAIGGLYDWYAGLASSFPFVERQTPMAGAVGLVVQEPVGVVAAVIPWNGPAVTAAFKCAPALLAGCTVVLKASPEAPGTLYLLAEACEKAGLPKGVFNVVTADRAVSEGLIAHPGVDKVSFTGSTAAGRRVAAICGDRIARTTLELGGKSPAIVLDDTDPEDVARVLCAQEIPVSGQVCSSLTRVIVSRRRHDALVEALAARFRAVRVGDPFDPQTEMGPLATRRQLERVQGYVARGIADGATLAAGGRRPAHLERGHYLEPTVFGNVPPDSTIATEEIFGPVLSVTVARDQDEAIAIANGTPYGLNASVFTRNVDQAYAIARRLRAGTVGHNEFRSDFLLGMGGFKQSGIGREGGVEGLRSYLERKVVILDALPAAVPGERAGS